MKYSGRPELRVASGERKRNRCVRCVDTELNSRGKVSCRGSSAPSAEMPEIVCGFICPKQQRPNYRQKLTRRGGVARRPSRLGGADAIASGGGAAEAPRSLAGDPLAARKRSTCKSRRFFGARRGATPKQSSAEKALGTLRRALSSYRSFDS
jgi:hypothetical protein